MFHARKILYSLPLEKRERRKYLGRPAKEKGGYINERIFK
jgi:hypothetical protein